MVRIFEFLEVDNSMSDISTLRSMILDAIANDYEDFAMVLHEVHKWCSEESRPAFNADAIKQELEQLLRLGFAKAYHLSQECPPQAVPREEAMSSIDHCYFLITPSGLAELESS